MFEDIVPPVTPAPEEKVEVSKAEFESLKQKADVSSQNFERAKAAEGKVKELEELKEKGKPEAFNPDKHKQEIDERVNLRMAGFEPEIIEQIEKFARGAGMSLSEAAKQPFVQKAVDGLRSEKKQTETTPPPTSKSRIFNGKSVDDIFKTGSEAEKQAAWEAIMKPGAKNNE